MNAIAIGVCLGALNFMSCQIAKIETKKDIKIVLFDVGGVLSHDMIDKKLADLAKKKHVSLAVLMRLKGNYREQADLGKMSDSAFWQTVLEKAGAAVSPDDAEIDSYLTLIDGSLELAKRVGQKNKVGILSNDSKEMASARRLKFGFDKIFNPIFISADLGQTKPGQQIYQTVSRKLGIRAEHILFIDNRAENVQSAELACYQTILFKDAKQLESALRDRGLL